MKPLLKKQWFRRTILLTPIAAAFLLIIPIIKTELDPFWLLFAQYIFLLTAIFIGVYLRRHPIQPEHPRTQPEHPPFWNHPTSAPGEERVPENRRNQIRKLITFDEINRLNSLSAPELLFAWNAAESSEQPYPHLMETLPARIAQKLRSESALFLLKTSAYHTPLLLEHTARIFTRASFCEACIDRFSAQFLLLTRQEIPRGGLPDVLRQLELAGCTSVLVDDGEESILLPMELLLPQKPPSHFCPDFQAACLNFFQLLSSSRYCPSSMEESVQDAEFAMLREALLSRFLVPVQTDPQHPDEPPHICPLLDENSSPILPLYTDLYEYGKLQSAEQIPPAVIDLGTLLNRSKEDTAFVVNPKGFNLVFRGKSLERLRRYHLSHSNLTPPNSSA